MRDGQKTKAELIEEIESLRSRLSQLEQEGRNVSAGEESTTENTFHILLDNSVDGVVLVDIESKSFYTANNVFCRMLDYTLDEIKNMRIQDIHSEQYIPIVLGEFSKHAYGEPALAEDIQVKRKNGDFLYVDIFSLPGVWNGHKCLAGVFRDVTDRKNIEKALNESRMRYQTLLENLPQKIFLKDKDSVYLSCNENLARNLKISPEEIIGKTDYDFFPGELAEKYRADDVRVM